MPQQSQEPKTILTPLESPRPKAQPKYLQIRDLDKYQHYKNRNPPWVKLHGEQLDDYEFQQLPDAVKFHALALTYLAAKTGNKIPYDVNWVASRIGAQDPVNLDALMAYGFLEPWQPRLQQPGPGEQLDLPGDPAVDETPTGPATSTDASKMLASCKHLASTETETEAETETHTETDTAPASAGRSCACCGLCVFSEFSFENAFALVSRWKAEGRLISGRPIENVGGLARKLHKEGTADAEIRLMLHPPQRREFTDRPCTKCFGAKMEVVQGKARPCEHCRDEQGKRTGLEPQAVGSEGT